jgi:hypothetical protein
VTCRPAIKAEPPSKKDESAAQQSKKESKLKGTHTSRQSEDMATESTDIFRLGEISPQKTPKKMVGAK